MSEQKTLGERLNQLALIVERTTGLADILITEMGDSGSVVLLAGQVEINLKEIQALVYQALNAERQEAVKA